MGNDFDDVLTRAVHVHALDAASVVNVVVIVAASDVVYVEARSADNDLRVQQIRQRLSHLYAHCRVNKYLFDKQGIYQMGLYRSSISAHLLISLFRQIPVYRWPCELAQRLDFHSLAFERRSI